MYSLVLYNALRYSDIIHTQANINLLIIYIKITQFPVTQEKFKRTARNKTIIYYTISLLSFSVSEITIFFVFFQNVNMFMHEEKTQYFGLI